MNNIADDIHNAYERGYADGVKSADRHGEWKRGGLKHQYFCSVCGGKEGAPRTFCL